MHFVNCMYGKSALNYLPMNTIFYQVTIFQNIINRYRTAINSNSLWLQQFLLQRHAHVHTKVTHNFTFSPNTTTKIISVNMEHQLHFTDLKITFFIYFCILQIISNIQNDLNCSIIQKSKTGSKLFGSSTTSKSMNWWTVPHELIRKSTTTQNSSRCN